MLETKDQKQIFAGSLVLILILSLVSVWHQKSFTFQDETDYISLQKKSEQQRALYRQYLVALGTTQEAQTALYEEILPPEEVLKAVEKELDANQPIVIPEQPKTAMRVSSATGKNAVSDYVTSTQKIVEDLDWASQKAENDLLNASGDTHNVDVLISQLQNALNEYSKLSVPQEAQNFQGKQLVALEEYLKLAKLSQSYSANPNISPWPNVYKHVSIIAESAYQAEQNFNGLVDKYNLSEAEDSSNLAQGSWLVPKADALFFSIVVDIFQKAETVVRAAAATAVAQFTIYFLQKLANQIQKAYTITNYLYYSDALVSGQYVDDYLNKYVDNSLDRNIIKQFIPAVGCGKNQNLTPIFKAKADQYLGFDPNSLDPKDPDYFIKFAKVGNFLSSPTGWEVYYKDVAAQAAGTAKQSAQNELVGLGTKSTRDTAGGILTSALTTVDTLRATLQTMLSSGFIGNAGGSLAAKISSQATQVFLNTFIFKGAVLKEQRVCIPVPVVNFVNEVPLEAPPDVVETKEPPNG